MCQRRLRGSQVLCDVLLYGAAKTKRNSPTNNKFLAQTVRTLYPTNLIQQKTDLTHFITQINQQWYEQIKSESIAIETKYKAANTAH